MAVSGAKIAPVLDDRGETINDLQGAPTPEITVVGAAPVARTAVPLLAFAMRAAVPDGRDIHSIALSAAIYVDPARRSYDRRTQARLCRLLGPRQRWAAATGILWRKVDALVSAFRGETVFGLPVLPASDLSEVATVYFSCLDGGEAPLTFYVVGTALYRDANNLLETTPLPANASESFDLPIETWRRAFDGHQADIGWHAVVQRRLAASAGRRG